MKLISNNIDENHLTEILLEIDKSDEVTICIAFLKISGLIFLLDKLITLKDRTTFYVGKDFYITEPKALSKLYNLGFKVFITNEKGITYHPKIYYLKNKESIVALVGSSNLTSGGLKTNIETSVKLCFDSDSNFDIQFKELFKHFESKSTLINSQEIISDYEKRYLIYRDKHNQADKDFIKEELLLLEEEKKREEERLKKKAERTKPNGERDHKEENLKITPEYLLSWPEKLEEFKLYKKSNNGNPIVNKKHSLYPWYRKQKNLYQAEDENGVKRIPSEHLDLLEKEGFYWGNGKELNSMQKWEIQLSKSIEYSFLKKQSYVWVVWEKRDPNFKYKEQATWCIRQRRRISGKDQKPISPYELRRLKEVNFLFESENEGGVVNQDGFIQHLIDLENLKNKCLKAGIRRWIPSQTDPDPIVAELGGWLADNLTFIRNHTKNGTKPELVKSRSKDLNDLGIDTIIGKEKNNFEFDVLDWLEMKKLYPIENPKGEARKPFVKVLNWESGQRNKYDSAQPWKQKRLVELKIVNLQTM